jgi:TRAP-type C4-dicarboxylate transport system permease large subunit
MVHGAVAGEFQASAAAGWALFQMFLTTLGVSAGSYTATEAANIPTLL